MAEKAKVLIVDDEELLRHSLSVELISEGYEVETAGDGDEAIELLRQKTFDIILLDIRMPKINGFEVLKFIKQNKPDVRVIMLTAYADVRNAIEAMKLGAIDFVSKPYDLVDILSSIQRALGR